MDSFEWNKIAGAVLGTLIFVMVVKIASDTIFEVPKPAKPGYVVEGVAEENATAGAAAQPAEEAIPDFGAVLPTADVSAGEKVAARCQQCHDLTKGGPNKIGPNLWGLVGRPRASHPGFDYSSAMMAKHDPWSYEDLFRYLKSPATMVPGTKMSFAGLRSAQDRINLLAYLRTQADTPAPIPAPGTTGTPATPASGKAPAAAPKGAAPASPAGGTPSGKG